MLRNIIFSHYLHLQDRSNINTLRYTTGEESFGHFNMYSSSRGGRRADTRDRGGVRSGGPRGHGDGHDGRMPSDMGPMGFEIDGPHGGLARGGRGHGGIPPIRSGGHGGRAGMSGGPRRGMESGRHGLTPSGLGSRIPSSDPEEERDIEAAILELKDQGYDSSDAEELVEDLIEQDGDLRDLPSLFEDSGSMNPGYHAPGGRGTLEGRHGGAPRQHHDSLGSMEFGGRYGGPSGPANGRGGPTRGLGNIHHRGAPHRHSGFMDDDDIDDTRDMPLAMSRGRGPRGGYGMGGPRGRPSRYDDFSEDDYYVLG